MTKFSESKTEGNVKHDHIVEIQHPNGFVEKHKILLKPRIKARGKGNPRGRPFAKGDPRVKEFGFKPGKSGNPSGHPKGSIKLISSAYTIQLGEQCGIPGLEHMTWAEAIALGMAKTAANGEVAAAREMRETTEGKTPDRVIITEPPTTEANELNDRIAQLIGVKSDPTEDESGGEDGAPKPAPAKARAAEVQQDTNVLPGRRRTKKGTVPKTP